VKVKLFIYKDKFVSKIKKPSWSNLPVYGLQEVKVLNSAVVIYLTTIRILLLNIEIYSEFYEHWLCMNVRYLSENKNGAGV
jgi:hypothetical protein